LRTGNSGEVLLQRPGKWIHKPLMPLKFHWNFLKKKLKNIFC